MKGKKNVKKVRIKLHPFKDIPRYTCPYCGYSWEPRANRPVVCPNPECHKKLPWSKIGRPKKVSKRR